MSEAVDSVKETLLPSKADLELLTAGFLIQAPFLAVLLPRLSKVPQPGAVGGTILLSLVFSLAYVLGLGANSLVHEFFRKRIERVERAKVVRNEYTRLKASVPAEKLAGVGLVLGERVPADPEVSHRIVRACHIYVRSRDAHTRRRLDSNERQYRLARTSIVPAGLWVATSVWWLVAARAKVSALGPPPVISDIPTLGLLVAFSSGMLASLWFAMKTRTHYYASDAVNAFLILCGTDTEQSTDVAKHPAYDALPTRATRESVLAVNHPPTA